MWFGHGFDCDFAGVDMRKLLLLNLLGYCLKMGSSHFRFSINLNFYQRIRVMSLVQQALYVFGLLIIGQTIIVWVEGIMGSPTPIITFFGAPFIGMLIWPLVYITLRDIRRKANIN